MAEGVVQITAGSGTPVRVLTGLGPNSAGQQVLTLGDSLGNLNPSDPDGTQNVSAEATTLFSDDFSGTLSATWTTGGTAPTNANGQSTFASSTTASAASYMRSIGAFGLRQASYLRPVFHVQVETGAVANSQRWWGIGLNQGSPTAAAPVLNGAVFELNYADGTLRAAIYSAGTRTQIAALTRPTDGALHRYELWYRQSRIDWVQDGTVVATRLFPNLAVANNLALIAGSVNFTTAPSAAPVLILSAAGVADHSGTNRTMSDGVNPWIQASVKSGNTTPVSSDNPLVVSLHPSSNGLAAGTARIGSVYIGSSVSPSTVFQTSSTTNTAYQLKISSGLLQALIITNNSGSAQWVKVYNATSVTLGTTAAVMDVQVAAGATLTVPMGPNGVPFSTGMFFAVTGAAGLTNNTAGAGSVTVAAVYM